MYFSLVSPTNCTFHEGSEHWFRCLEAFSRTSLVPEDTGNVGIHLLSETTDWWLGFRKAWRAWRWFRGAVRQHGLWNHSPAQAAHRLRDLGRWVSLSEPPPLPFYPLLCKTKMMTQAPQVVVRITGGKVSTNEVTVLRVILHWNGPLTWRNQKCRVRLEQIFFTLEKTGVSFLSVGLRKHPLGLSATLGFDSLIWFWPPLFASCATLGKSA